MKTIGKPFYLGSGLVRPFPILGTLLALMLLVGLAFQFWQSRQEALNKAEHITRTLSELLEQRISGDFERLDALLGFAATEFQPQQLATLPANDRHQQAKRLARLMDDFPEIAGAFIFDETGALQLTTLSDVKPFTIADRPHFISLRDNPALTTVFSDPQIARSTGKLAIVQSRAIRESGTGRFLGIVNAIYHLDALNEEISRIDVGPRGVTLLRRTDNFKLVARYPRLNPTDFGQPLPVDNPIRQRIAQGDKAGFLVYKASTDGQTRLGSFRILERYPFYVQVAYSEADYLEPWNQQTKILAGVFLLMGAPILIALIRLGKAQAREQTAAEILLNQQQKIAESETLLRRVIDTMPHIVIVKDASGRFVLVNRALSRLYNSTPEAMEGKDDADFNPNREQVDFYRRNIQEIIAKGETQVVEETSTDALTGEVHRYQSVKVPFMGRHGEPNVLVVATDITDLHETQERLRASEQRMAFTLMATREGLWDWSIPEDRVDHNEQWGIVFGLTEVPKSHPVSFFAERIHPDDRDTVMARVGKALETDGIYDSEHRVIWPDGQVIWVHDRGQVVVRDATGAPIRMVGSIRDITERKENELALIEAKQAAEAATVAKSRFLATMSHEIRTPMNGILGMAQMLLTTEVSEENRRDYARTILNSGQSLLRLLNDILDYSKVEAGKLTLEPMVFKPEQLIFEVQSLFAEAARSQGLALHGAWQGKDISYEADANRIRQMLSNLIGNAIKFTARGEIRITAREIAQTADGATLEFAVNDTGPGIPAEKQALLFQPFSQADSSTTRQFGGTGLGLSIVKNLARLMNGDAGLESTPGKGSRFWFRIQARIVLSSERRNQIRESDAALMAPQAPKADLTPLNGSLLVVEDNKTNQKVIRALLENLGLRVMVAENGQEALECIGQNAPFDLILMDIQMPVMDGITATQRIRQQETALGESRNTIVALTADAFAEDRQRCLQAGMDDFLTKPVDIAAITRLLHRWLPQASQTKPVTESLSAKIGGPAQPTFDASALLRPIAGDRELAQLIIYSAQQDFPAYLAQLETACQQADWAAAMRPTHTMKSLAAQVGGLALSKLVTEAHEGLRRGEPLSMDSLRALRSAYAELTTALQAWIAQTRSNQNGD